MPRTARPRPGHDSSTRSKRWHRLLLALFAAVCLSPGLLAQHLDLNLLRYTRQSWDTGSGLPQNTVHQVLQTSDGFLWIATEGGLVRFDGVDFTTYSKRDTPAFHSDVINALFEDTGKNLWIATANGLLEHSGDSFRLYSTAQGLPSNTIWSISQDSSGAIWVATEEGLAHKHADSFANVPRSGHFPARLDTSFIRSSKGSLWAISKSTATCISPDGQAHVQMLPDGVQPVAAAPAPDGGLIVVAPHRLVHLDPNGSVTPVGPPRGSDRISFSSLVSEPGGDLWLGTANGLYRFHAAKWLRVSTQAVRKLYLDHDGSLWVLSPTRLSMLHDGQMYDIADNEAEDAVLTLTSDNEGDVWLGTENSGVSVVRRLPFAMLGQHDGLASDNVRSILSFKDRVWFGTSSGLSTYTAGRFQTTTVEQGIASNQIIALAAEDETLWIGTPDGLSRFADKQVRTFTASEGLPDDDIRSILVARDHTLWIGTTHGLAHLSSADGTNIQTFTSRNGLGSNVIGSLLEERDGSLWIGTLNGLSKLTAQGIHNYGNSAGLSSPIVTALSEDSRNRLWVGTNGGGLFRFAHDRLSPVISAHLPSTIYGILEDAEGHLWLSSSTGVYRVAASDLARLADDPHVPIPINHYTVADGLRLEDCGSGGHPEATLAPDGRLWLATLHGASVVNTADPSLSRPAPPVALERVDVGDAPQTWTGAGLHSVPTGNSRLAFHYAGISLASPSKVRYQYLLLHFDRNWVDAGMRRSAFYTNIPPGHYTFLVRATIDGAHWSNIAASASFTIAPRYYETWWFYLLMTGSAALLAWQIYLYRLRQVELRFHAVVAERGRIAREIHDTLAQDIVAISVQLELVSRLMSISVDKAGRQLSDTRALVRKSLADARSSIWDLRSVASPATDLPTRMREVTSQVPRDPAIDLRFNTTGTYRSFARITEEEFVRIAQEAVTNAIKHASPRTIAVSLLYHATGMRLEVQDDGSGFKLDDRKTGPPGHYGLRGMYERASRARAKLEITSQPGTGTLVIAESEEKPGD